MACQNSDLEIFPKLAEHSKKLMKLEEYLSFVIESTQYWHESKYMVKNEIRETFSALSSILHQREMQLYRQVDELRINLSSSALNLSHENSSQQRKDNLKCSGIPKRPLSSPCVSPPLKLKFQADIKSLEEVINSFGCLEVEDGSVLEDNNFIFINPEDGLSMDVENLSLQSNDLDQSVPEDRTETSSVGSADSFEILPDGEASVPWSNKRSSDVDDLSLHRSNVEQNDVPNQTGSPPVASSSSCNSVGVLPDNKSPDSWLRIASGNDASVCCTGPVKDPSSSVTSVGSSSRLPYPFASNGNAQWLRKSGESKSPPGAVSTTQDTACVLAFTDAFKDKGNQASVEGFSKLSSHFKSTGAPENNKSATGATGNTAITGIIQNGNPYLAVGVPDSGTVPDFQSVISKMFGNGNEGWLGRDHSSIVQPLSNQSYNKGVKDTVTQKSIFVGRTPFQTAALDHVNNIEKSNSPAVSINKMFSPYFKNHDKNIWLAKNRTTNKNCSYS